MASMHIYMIVIDVNNTRAISWAELIVIINYTVQIIIIILFHLIYCNNCYNYNKL